MAIISPPPAVVPATRKERGPLVTVLIWLLVAPALIWAIIRIFGWERGPLVPLFAFTPYAAAWSLIPLALALATRRWPAAAVALVAVLALAAAVLPRFFPD